MAVKKEIKSHLARLLATEDLIVEHKDVETAQFNVQTRELLLPMWDKASEEVYDMLVGHEVGHALFTPNIDPPSDVPHSILNVCEDARIEKLMKRKYLGIAKSFYKGYNEMHKQDFFEVENENIDTFNLADRANLYFKIGQFLDVSFSDAEKEIISLIQNADTFTQTIAAAKALHNFCQQEQEAKEQLSEATEGVQSEISPESDGNDSVPTGDSDSDSIDDTGSSVSDSDSNDTLEGRDSDPNPGTRGGTTSDSVESEVRTADSLADKLKGLITKDAVENVYLEVNDVNLENVIATNSDVHEYVNGYWSQCVERRREMEREGGYEQRNVFEEVDQSYEDFKNSAKKEVSYLVKEFECKKSADAYARASTSRTGILDTRNLHTYKYNEDLFKRVTMIPDGKNHGLVFILDWSGSMCYEMADTIKQLYNLVWFCKKVQIPFEVYAFTNEWHRNQEEYEYGKSRIACYEEKEHTFHIDNDFALMNILSSKVNGKELDSQLKNIWRIVGCFNRHGSRWYHFPPAMNLSGTPLNETLICLHEILPQFKKENDLQKVQCIILTDGEASSLPYHTMVERSWEDAPRMGMRNTNAHTCTVRDRKLGKNYTIGYGYWELTDTLLRNLKDKFTDVNFIGIRVLQPRDAKRFVERFHPYYSKEYESIMADWRKHKTFTVTGSGYDAYFGLSSTVLAEDSEFDVDEDATKAQIKRAFVKSLKTKKLNKKVLGEFISLVV